MFRKPVPTRGRPELFLKDLTRVNRSYNPPRYRSEIDLVNYFIRQLRGINSGSGKALEIGAGDGVFACVLALAGYEVDAIDPYSDGADSQSAVFFGRVTKSESVGGQISLLRTDLNALENGQYDLVVLHNVINHLDEEACLHLRSGNDSFAKYVEIFRGVRGLMRSGATLLVTDCSRLNFFGLFRIRNPFAPAIEWKLHQQPRLWAQVLREAGFTDFTISWNSPSILGFWGRMILANRAGAFFTSSHFRLLARCS